MLCEDFVLCQNRSRVAERLFVLLTRYTYHSPAFSSINGSFAARSVPNLTYLSTPFSSFSFVEVIPSFPCTAHNTVHCTILYPLSQPLSASRTITFHLMIIYPISGLASDCLPTAPSALPPLRTGAFSGVWLRKPFSKKA